MKKSNIRNTLRCIHVFVLKGQFCYAKIAYLEDIANLESYPMVCTFQKSCHLLKLSKMLMSNIYNWLLQGNGAITRVLAYCKILAR